MNIFSVNGQCSQYQLPSPMELRSTPFLTGNFEFEFCKNKEKKFNSYMPCISYFVVFHTYLRILQILLIFRRYHVMYSIFCILHCAGVAFERLFSYRKTVRKKVKHYFLITLKIFLNLYFV